jgi:hypothetical protein
MRTARLHETAWLPPEHIETVRGLPVTTVPRTVFDLAGMTTFHWSRNPDVRERQMAVHAKRVGRLLDTTLQRFGNTVEAQNLVLAGLGRKGRAGTAVMRVVMAERTGHYVPTESELEDLFLEVCRAFGLPTPERQIEVGNDRPIGRVDFVFRAARLIVEVDGRPWHDSVTDIVSDNWRDLELEAAGWTVVRLRWRQLVDDPERVVRLLEQRLALAA